MFVFLPYLNVFSFYLFYLTHLVFYLLLFILYSSISIFLLFFLGLFIYPLVFSGFLHFFILIFYFTFPPNFALSFSTDRPFISYLSLDFSCSFLCECTQSLEQYCPFAARISELRCGNCVVNVFSSYWTTLSLLFSTF